MNTLSRVIVAVSIISFFGCGGGGGGSEQRAISTGTQVLRQEPVTLQEALDNMIDTGGPGAMVYYESESPVTAKPGPGLAAKPTPRVITSGVADIGSRQPMSDGLRFRIGGLTALFMGVLAFQLEEEGLLDPKASIEEILPSEIVDPIENDQLIRLHHLLTHRTGIPGYLYGSINWRNGIPDEQAALDLVLGRAASFPPGERAEFNHSNLLLLALVLDEVLGFDHRQAIVDRILVPLGMANTFFSFEEPGAQPVMKGYHEGNEISRLSMAVPGIDMISTVGDIATFLRALFTTEDLLTTEQRERFMPEIRPAGSELRYRYGMFALAKDGTDVALVGNGDFFIGYTVEAFYIPGRDEILIIVSNDSSIELIPGRVNTRELILDLLYQQ